MSDQVEDAEKHGPAGAPAGAPSNAARRPSIAAVSAGRFEVLFERRGRHPGQLVGRSPYLQAVQVDAPASLIGEIAAVTISDIASNSLFGVLAACAAAQQLRSAIGAGA